MQGVAQKLQGLAREWKYATLILLLFLLVGILLAFASQPMIGTGLIGISWIGFLWPIYTYLVKPYL